VITNPDSKVEDIMRVGADCDMRGMILEAGQPMWHVVEIRWAKNVVAEQASFKGYGIRRYTVVRYAPLLERRGLLTDRGVLVMLKSSDVELEENSIVITAYLGEVRKKSTI
jgi:hypothetical protein